MNNNNNRIDDIANAYFLIKKYVISKGYSNEIDYSNYISLSTLSEAQFLREIAWVILSSGMSYNSINKNFKNISLAFYNWYSAESIYKSRNFCKRKALKFFNNENKINAIIASSEIVYSSGFHTIKNNIQDKGIDYLENFPFIGPATKYHLAKNIGFNLAKPDRHLLRISTKLGFSSPNNLCQVLSNRIAEDVSVIDLVIWRYATLDRKYLLRLNNFF